MWSHYFLCSGGKGTDSTKAAKTRYAEHIFLYRVEYVGHVVHFSASRARNVSTSSCSGGLSVVTIKSAPIHVTPNLYFCIWWYMRVCPEHDK
jgi:hypothetical protein